jgi:energy-coupling factor transporter transmembrane protein EcfT
LPNLRRNLDRPLSKHTLLAACLVSLIVVVVALLDAKLYQNTEPPPPSGILGLHTWSVTAATRCVGIAGLCLLAWAPARRLLIALPFIVLLLGITGFATKQSLSNLGPDPCYQLNGVNVGTLQSFSTVIGPTDGPQWINVLTDGVTDPAPVDRMAIVRAVDSSEASATQLISSLPLSLRSPARRLVAVAGSPTTSLAERSSVGIRADVSELSDYAFRACGDAG